MKHLIYKSLGYAFIASLFLLFSAHEVAAQKKKKDKDDQQQEMIFDEGNNVMSEEDIRQGIKAAEAEYLFAEGMKFFILDDYAKALTSFEECHKMNPDNVTVNYKIAEILLKQNKAAAALPYAESVVKADSKNKYYYALLANIYEAQEKYDDAAKVYKQLLTSVKDAEMYYFDLANVHIYQGKYDDAIRAYDNAEKRFGIDEAVIRQKQKIYLTMRNVQGAISEGQKLLDAYPDEPEYFLNQAELLLGNRKADDARKVLNHVLQISPDDAHARLLLAEVYQMQGDKEKYMSELQMAFSSAGLDFEAKMNVLMGYYKNMQSESVQKTGLKLAEMTVKAHPEHAKAHAALGNFQAVNRMTREARSSYLTALRFDPDDYQLWERIINFDLQLKEYDSLVKHSEQALEVFPNQGVFWFYNGIGHYVNHNYEEAVDALEQGKMLSSDNEDLQFQIYAQLGDSYNGLKEYEKSDKAYEKALSLKPQDVYVLNNYSYFLSVRKEKLDLARKLSAQLISLEPENATYLDTYGWVLYVAGDYKNARVYLEKASRVSQSGTIIEHYGDVLFQLGQLDEAVVQWKRAKSLGGDLSKDIDKKIADRKLYE